MTAATTIARCIAAIGPVSATARQQALDRLLQLTMPRWAMGQLLDTALDLAGIADDPRLTLPRKAVVVMAGDHGVCAQGVSAYPQEVTAQMVANFVAGGATINALAAHAGATVVVVDMGVRTPIPAVWQQGQVLDRRIAAGTGDIAIEAAMSRDQAEAALAAGIELATGLAADYDLLATGEMGIGNTTPSAAITALLCRRDPAAVTGRGTGVDDAGYATKVAAVTQALERCGLDDGADAVAVLCELGGFEIAGLAGLILGASAARRPVLIDGFITCAAALIAQVLCPQATDYCIASHQGAEPGHAIQLAHLGKRPLLHLGLRLGEGSGAALAMPLLDAACRLLTEVATFGEAAVSQ